MKMKHSLLASAALLSLATAAQAVDFGGYFRVGPGSKAANKCFQEDVNYWGGKYRLGNECNTYGEFELSQGGKAGGVQYKALLMTNFFKPGSDVGDGSTTIKVNQIYAEAKGFDVAPDSTFWVGRRFYGRADVHMVDNFFVNLTGSGAGVEAPLAGGKLGLAFFRTDESGTTRGSRVNVDMQGIDVNPGGKLRITGTATDFNGKGGKNGYGLSLQHNQAGLPGDGENTLWLQFAQGSADLRGNFGNGTDGSNVKSWRLIESPTWVKGPLTAQGLALVGKLGQANGSKLAIGTVGARVGYAITNNFKMQGELGYSREKPENGKSRDITKFTIAPTLTVGPNYYDRPEFRLYYTYASWNNAYRDVPSNFAIYGNKKSGNSAGIQVEMWF